ncbi:MAG: hypothetical protein AB8G18_17610 [Gammaproteobacteria bacterium]
MTILSTFRFALVTAIWAIATSGMALAANQGTTTPGSSTGDVDVVVTTGLVARVSGLNDINLGVWSGSGDLSGSDNLCIGRSGVGLFANGTYRVRLDGDGDASDIHAFTLSNGTDLLYYNVAFNDATGTGGTPVTGGVMLNGQTGFGFWQFLNVLFGCSVNNANIEVTVPAVELQSVPGGNYTGTLTIVLIPE